MVNYPVTAFSRIITIPGCARYYDMAFELDSLLYYHPNR